MSARGPEPPSAGVASWGAGSLAARAALADSAGDAPAPLIVPPRDAGADTSAEDRALKARESYQLGIQLESKGLYGSAIGAYDVALRYDPAFADAHYRIGRLFLRRDEVRDAARQFAAELRHHPAHAGADRELGLALARLGDTTRAIARLEHLTRARPRDDESWRALGFAYSVAGRTAQAERALRRAIAIAPDRAAEHRDLGVLLATQNREREAREHYAKALAADSADATTWLDLGNLESRAGHHPEALAAYRRAEAADSGMALAIQGQIDALGGLGRDAEAGATYRRWLKLKPDDVNARLEAVHHFNRADRPDIALEIARDGVRRNERSADAHTILGIALQYSGEIRAAVRELRRAQVLAGDPATRAKVEPLVALVRASAPDSLRAFLLADSVAAAARADTLRTRDEAIERSRQPKTPPDAANPRR